jgi:RND family efflux transporter MFP subunit
VETPAAAEEIPAGRVRVGSAAAPGGLIAGGPSEEGEVSFLKEQQWKTEFATAAVSLGSIRESVTGPGRVRAAADGEVVLSAPLDGQVPADAVLHVGQAVRRGAPVLTLAPQAGSGRTAAELESELSVARARLERLEELLRVEAASQAEVEAARAKLAALEPLAGAALGGIRGPFDGTVAEVFVVPGQSVSAGDPLVRVVRTDPLWIEADLPPASAARLGDGSGGLIVRTDASQAPLEIAAENVKSVARGPAVDSSTGTVPALFEVRGTSLAVGQAVEVEVLLSAERSGIVVPASAVVDDGGIPVVFVQADGESFGRKEIRVAARQGDRMLVEGLRPGSRLVTTGGAAIRRASLISSGGAGHGHVH